MNTTRAISSNNEPIMEGEMLAIRPSIKTWQSFAKIQQAVGFQLKNEGITTWYPTPIEKAHFTLFAGLGNLDKQERQCLMKRIAQKTAKINRFKLKITMNEQALDSEGVLRKTNVKRGPYKWVTLGLANDQLQALRIKVKEAIVEAIQAEEIDPTKVDLDKFHKNNGTHITLGVLDIDDSQYSGLEPENPKQHPDVQQLNDLQGKIDFGAILAHKFKGQNFYCGVEKVSLIGIDKLQLKASEKEYYDLGYCSIGRSTYILQNKPERIK